MGFIEKILSRKLNFSEEIKSINDLMTESWWSRISIEEAAEDNFKNWKHRRTFITLSQMKTTMGISDLIKRACSGHHYIEQNEFIYYAEYAINTYVIGLRWAEHPNKEVLFKNVINVLDYCNYEIKWLDNDEYYVIIPKNYEINLSVNIIREPNLCESIIMYHHHSIKGNIYEKAIILSRLYMYYENKLEKVIVNFDKTFHNEIKELSNKLKIRHDKPNTKEEIVVGNMTNVELEGWYDKLFALYLRAVILGENSKIKPDLEELRKRLNSEE